LNLGELNEYILALYGKINRLFGFYGVAVFGTLGWLYVGKIQLALLEAAIFTLALAGFFASNVLVLRYTRAFLVDALAERRALLAAGSCNLLTETFKNRLWVESPTIIEHFWIAHFALDASVLVLIWLRVASLA
jgi:hypothetical protein